MSELPDLESLRLLVDVDRLGSLGQAARAGGIAQPSASKRISLLERRLGLPLLERTPRGSTLTPQGAMVSAWATQVLSAAEELMRGVEAVRHGRAAHLHIAASMTVAEYLLPRWLGELQSRESEVQVGLDVQNSAEVAKLVGGGVELGFVEGPSVPAGLASRVVATDRLVVVVAPGRPGRGAGPRCSPPSWPPLRWSSASAAPAPARPWTSRWPATPSPSPGSNSAPTPRSRAPPARAPRPPCSAATRWRRSWPPAAWPRCPPRASTSNAACARSGAAVAPPPAPPRPS